MRGVSSTGLEIESWHLPSTWIPCQASCICGFIYMPSLLLLKDPALAEPSAWNLLPHLRMAPPCFLQVSTPVQGLPLSLSPALPSPSTLLCVSL